MRARTLSASRRPLRNVRTAGLALAMALGGAAATAPCPPAAHAAAARVADVRVEYLANPIGLDAKAPRFSWVLESPERGTRQAAYQIRVASSAAKLAKGEADVWDSGRVESADHALVPWRGPALAPRTRYHVGVTVWDDKGRRTNAAPAFFETGVLDASAWKAKWITLEPKSDDERLPLVGGRWIWAPAAKDESKLKRLGFRHGFTLPVGVEVRRAELVIAAPGVNHPWRPEAQVHTRINDRELRTFAAEISDPRRLLVPDGAVRAGDNQIEIDAPYVSRRGLTATLYVELADGSRRLVQTDKTWRVRTFDTHKLPDAWHTERTDAAPWSPVVDLGAFGDVVDPQVPAFKQVDEIVPPLVLRKTFRVDKPVASARVYATAAGIYELRLNGAKVGRDALTPGWTDYGKRVRYQTYDVTAAIRRGDNVIGGQVADGWYSGRTGMGQNLWGFGKALFAELVLTYADGTSEIVATDESWRGTTGPWRSADLLDGELYDARRELPGWDAPGFADATWRPVVVTQPNVGRIEAQMDPPVRPIETLPARTVSAPAPGTQVFDLGQNMVGWARIKLRAPAGTVVRFRYVEMLNKDGTPFTDNLRTAIVTDRYVAKGTGQETYESRFTFHGFRYVEVSGLPKPLPVSAVTGIVLHNDLPVVGEFESSNPTLNRLQKNILWGQKGNFLSVPTDCPQRDERLGWTGDINMFARTAVFNMDAAPFLAKFLVDLEDGQRADGAFPDVAPTTPVLGAGNFGWGDVGVFLPWLLYEVYGDRDVLARHYDAMKKWVDFRTAGAKNYLNRAWSFGDWVSPPPQTPNEVLGPMYHAHAARLLARAARVLGKDDDAAKYDDLVEKIRAAFAKEFVTPDGKIKSDTQSAYIVALRYDMLPANLREAAAGHLEAAIARANRHLNTGFLGTGNLLPALSLAKKDELAYELLMKDTYPSWLYTVKNGATTMWERWNSYSPETGPSNVGDMNSYNHYAFGAVGEWMYANVAGLDLDPTEPGFRRVRIRPVLGGGLTSAKARFRSIRGTIASAWTLAKGQLTLDVEVPVHATARVHVPAASADEVREGGKPASTAPGVKVVGVEGQAAVFEVGPGRYRFTAPRR